MDAVSFVVDNRGRSCPTAESGFPLIATNSILGRRRDVVPTNVRYVDQATYDNWFRAHPVPGDVLLVCKGNAGRVAVVPDPVPYCIAQDMVALRADPAVVDPMYLYYRLASPEVQGLIRNMHVGSLIPHFKKGDFKNLHFDVHQSIVEQRRIALTLSALDDLVEHNRRLLEQVVALQRAAFVHASSQVATLGEVAQITMGQSPPGSSFNEAGEGTVFYQGVRDFGFRFPTRRVWTTEPKRLAQAGDVLVAVRAPVGEVNIATELTALGRGLGGVRAPNRQSTLLQALTTSSAIWDIHQGTGTVFAAINKDEMAQLRIPWVDDDQIEASLAALDQGVLGLQREVEDLTATRDELLPLLMSGKVRVRDLEGVA